MAEMKTKRRFEERFLEGFDRSQLRQEVQKVPRLSGMKRRYASWALGASLALGGIAPLRMIQNAQHSPTNPQEAAAEMTIDRTIAGDLRAAGSIAQQVAGGVAAGVES